MVLLGIYFHYVETANQLTPKGFVYPKLDRFVQPGLLL